MNDHGFVTFFNAAQYDVHQNAKNKGFHDEPRTVGDGVALIATELGEYYEAFRMGNPPSEKIPGFSLMEEELADKVIRAMDEAQLRNFRLAEAIVAKIKYNLTRPHKHGGKVL